MKEGNFGARQKIIDGEPEPFEKTLRRFLRRQNQDYGLRKRLEETAAYDKPSTQRHLKERELEHKIETKKKSAAKKLAQKQSKKKNCGFER